MPNKFYITTTLPYVNAKPHIGFALEIIQADVIARWQRQQGKEVFFNTGTDEHGLKIYRKALEEGKEPQAYCDEYAAKFDDLKQALNLSYNAFIRTTGEHHLKAAQEFWRRCDQNGDIYKKNYKVKYCVGCELEKTESELLEGKCPIHPNLAMELIEEENYFFKFSKYQKPLLDLYDKNKDFVMPEWRLKEIKNFVAGGLEDFSISRLKEKMPWGVPVPGDDKQVMYVWFDALINYISTLGWPSYAEASAGKPDDEKKFKEFWGTAEKPNALQIAGKDNLRQQAAMWQAMLMSAGLPPSKQILIHGFINSGGQKMSKSLGNVIDPFELVEKYGTDAVRYYLLAEITPFEDGDFTVEKFAARYNADLVNGLGNLAARVSALLEKNNVEIQIKRGSDAELKSKIEALMAEYGFNEALQLLWQKLRQSDEILSAKKPWELKDQDEIKKILEPVARDILNVADLLSPFMPDTAEKIIKQFSNNKIKKGEMLFPRV
ncbi:methionine--tRNA ligase [Candidatus Falkowbacteria bacterium CG10_big_fil_rev_8_21_14_0_10_43_11]|uniref:Methionine--tRNA ligase n=1 Tax=Candidatus Falkowbacteria bacterium CG10_big_fil_rev_8_21_14_0_10_43_11 TaxID=1974568 RepID=A0A2M6WL99_9BACT|nr:MAG: methionine--tRNA ligase [Candidatus Falkowbacteria bacterium CG10_big_fil_rev_8_21_14_0_10_43_11]